MWNSWLTMLVMCLASVLILTFTDYNIVPNISEIASSFTLSCFFYSVFFFPINVYLILLIQFSGLIPFLMCSPFLVRIESSVFFVTLFTIDWLVFPNNNISLLLTTIFIIGLSFFFMSYLKCKYNVTFVAYKRIMRVLRNSYMINKEVDIFIILMILSILVLFFLSWR